MRPCLTLTRRITKLQPFAAKFDKTKQVRGPSVQPFILGNVSYNSNSPSFPSHENPIRHILSTLKDIFPQVAGLRNDFGLPRVTESDNFWRFLTTAEKDMSDTHERPAKIVVYGLDEWSGTQDLITGLLAEPLASHDQLLQLIKRWENSTEERYISHGKDTGEFSSHKTSPYLTQFSLPIKIIELCPPSKPTQISSASVLEKNLFSDVDEADIHIIVCNPLVTSLATVLNSFLPSNTILVLITSLSQGILDNLVQHQLLTLPGSRASELNSVTILAADPSRAVDAIGTLHSDPKSFTAIQKFQSDFVESRLSNITGAIKAKLRKPHSLETIRSKLALGHIHDVISWSLSSLNLVQLKLDNAFIATSNLKTRIEESTMRAETDIFGKSGKDNPVVLSEAISQAEKDIRPAFDKLTWWKMIWKVDQISEIIRNAVTEKWCRTLENELIMQTGRLSVLQREISDSSFTLLSNQANISTAVLRNNLLQIKASPAHSLSPQTLTQPLYSRRKQILEFPTAQLHREGQRAVFVMTCGVSGGLTIGWAGWLGWLLSPGEGLLGYIGIEPGMAIGVGLLTAVGSIRWGVGRWEKSKKRWWQDWVRVAEGLDRDLKVTLDKVMRENVTAIGGEACKGMLQVIRSREGKVASLKAELGKLDLSVKSILDNKENP